MFRVNDISPLRILLAREQAFTIVPLRSVHCGNAMFQARMYPISVEGVTLSSRVGLISGRRAGTRFVRSVFSAVRERAAEYQRIDPPTGADGGTGDK